MLSVFVSVFGSADDKSVNQAGENENIHITCIDGLNYDGEAKSAEFIGNVRATLGTRVLTADRLKVFFQDNPDNKKNISMSEESIKKIVATGNVRIKFDDKLAVSEKAVYMAETGVIVLTGPNSKIISEKNYISGEKITLYRADDRMKVESDGKKQVEALFYSKEKTEK